MSKVEFGYTDVAASAQHVYFRVHELVRVMFRELINSEKI